MAKLRIYCRPFEARSFPRLDEFFVSPNEAYASSGSPYSSPSSSQQSDTLGVGGMSIVRQMYKRGDHDHIYAVKEHELDEHTLLNDEGWHHYAASVSKETDLAIELSGHPNVVSTLGVYRRDKFLYTAMECCKYGDIWDLAIGMHYLTHGDRLCLFKQLLLGVRHMHSKGVAHHDLKLENVLLGNDGLLKIVDFGLAHVFKSRNFDYIACHTGAGTWGSIPPEATGRKNMDTGYDARGHDIWCCGIILYQLFTGNLPPWEEARLKDSGWKAYFASWLEFKKGGRHCPAISNSEYPECGDRLFHHLEPDIRRLVLLMLNPWAKERITIEDLLFDEFVMRIECCSDPTVDQGSIHHHHIPPAAR